MTGNQTYDDRDPSDQASLPTDMTTVPNEDFDPVEPIIAAVKSGDRYAFADLVRGQNRWVRGVIYGVLGASDRIDDVSQQVWTAVWQRIGDLRESRRWRPWLYRLARNAAIDAGREVTRRREKLQSVAAAPQAARQSSPDSEMAHGERHAEVLAAIQALPALYREPFVLRHLNGWGYREIAETIGLPVDTVETRLVRARRFLRDSLRHMMG